MVSRLPACLALVSTLTLAALPEIACHLSTRHPLSSFRAHLDTTTGAPVSDAACWRGTLDRAGSETGAPVAVMRRASFRAAGFSLVQRFMGGFDRMLPGELHSV